jgi:hypothetical protein
MPDRSSTILQFKGDSQTGKILISTIRPSLSARAQRAFVGLLLSSMSCSPLPFRAALTAASALSQDGYRRAEAPTASASPPGELAGGARYLEPRFNSLPLFESR